MGNIIWLLLLGWSTSTAARQAFFHKIHSLSNRKYDSNVPAVTTRDVTKLGCAVRCLNEYGCWQYSFNFMTKECTMVVSGDEVEIHTEPSDESTVFYVKRRPCPVEEPGYFYGAAADLCFKVSNFTVDSWEAAVEKCRSWDMELIKLDTRDRQAAVMDVLAAIADDSSESTEHGGGQTSILSCHDSAYIYIGAARPKEWWGNTAFPDDYFWLDGTKVEWQNSEFWQENQPNNQGVDECLGIYCSNPLIYNRPPDLAYNFICQMY